MYHPDYWVEIDYRVEIDLAKKVLYTRVTKLYQIRAKM